MELFVQKRKDRKKCFFLRLLYGFSVCGCVAAVSAEEVHKSMFLLAATRLLLRYSKTQLKEKLLLPSNSFFFTITTLYGFTVWYLCPQEAPFSPSGQVLHQVPPPPELLGKNKKMTRKGHFTLCLSSFLMRTFSFVLVRVVPRCWCCCCNAP